MKTERASRTFNVELRAENDEKHGTMITGKPIVYGSKTMIGDMFYEIIDPGALENTDLTDVRFLVNHNTDMIPLARSRRNNENSTMQLIPGDDGLNIRVDLDTEGNTEAKNLYSAVSRGDVSGMSFMFTVDGEDWEDLDSEMPTRHITGISKVFEVSAVTFPAYEATSIEAASDQKALESAKGALENARELRGRRINRLKTMITIAREI